MRRTLIAMEREIFLETNDDRDEAWEIARGYRDTLRGLRLSILVTVKEMPSQNTFGIYLVERA